MFTIGFRETDYAAISYISRLDRTVIRQFVLVLIVTQTSQVEHSDIEWIIIYVVFSSIYNLDRRSFDIAATDYRLNLNWNKNETNITSTKGCRLLESILLLDEWRHLWDTACSVDRMRNQFHSDTEHLRAAYSAATILLTLYIKVRKTI